MDVWVLFILLGTPRGVAMHSHEFNGHTACLHAKDLILNNKYAKSSKFFGKETTAICVPKAFDADQPAEISKAE